MASLVNIRENQKVIMWGFLIVFLFSLSTGFLVGGANLFLDLFGGELRGDAVGSVNDDIIHLEELNATIQQQMELARQQVGELDDRQRDQLENQAWEGLVAARLIETEVIARELGATGQEIYYVLENYPPNILQQSESFQTDGQFDPNLYLQALRNPQGDEWAPVERFLSTTLPGEKMTQLVLSSVYVSREEIKASWINRNVNATVDYLYVSPRKIDPSEMSVTDRDIKRRYRADRDLYTLPERRVLEYVFWPKAPSAADSQIIAQNAQDLLDRARGGEDFAELALANSQDPGSGVRGGDLGWFDRQQMVPAFSEAAFATGKGEYTGPVLTPFGYHVIHVRDRKDEDGKEQILASHILLNIEMTPQSVNDIRSAANVFIFDALDSSFAVAARRSGLTPRISAPLERGERFLPPPVGYLRAAVHFAFHGEVGDISSVYENDDVIMVARLESSEPAGVQPLDEVRNIIDRQLRQEQAEGQITFVMANIEEQLSRGIDWQTIADSLPEVDVRMSVTATLGGSFPLIGRSARLTGILKAMEPGETSPARELERGQIIVRLVSREEPDWERFASARDAEYQRLLNQRLNDAWTQWIADLKSNAEVVDNRFRFF